MRGGVSWNFLRPASKADSLFSDSLCGPDACLNLGDSAKLQAVAILAIGPRGRLRHHSSTANE